MRELESRTDWLSRPEATVCSFYFPRLFNTISHYLNLLLSIFILFFSSLNLIFANFQALFCIFLSFPMLFSYQRWYLCPEIWLESQNVENNMGNERKRYGKWRNSKENRENKKWRWNVSWVTCHSFRTTAKTTILSCLSWQQGRFLPKLPLSNKHVRGWHVNSFCFFSAISFWNVIFTTTCFIFSSAFSFLFFFTFHFFTTTCRYFFYFFTLIFLRTIFSIIYSLYFILFPHSWQLATVVSYLFSHYLVLLPFPNYSARSHDITTFTNCPPPFSQFFWFLLFL